MKLRSVSTLLRKLNVLSSVRGKITFILLALTFTAGGAGYLIYQSFERVSISVTEMTSDALPQLVQSNALISTADNAKNVMISIMMAQNSDDLTNASLEVNAAVTALQQTIAALPSESRAEFESGLAQVTRTLQMSIDARRILFENEARTTAMTEEMQGLAASLQGVLLAIADDAYFNISIKGEDTINSVEETMIDLVQNKFATLQSLLESRSEINLITGVALSLASTRDTALASILSDLALSSRDRLAESLDALNASESGATVGEDLTAIANVLDEVLLARNTLGGVDYNSLLGARQSADVTLAAAVDDMIFDLIIAADDASRNNRGTIQGLLDDEVAFLNTLLEINAKLSAFQIEALKIATSPTVEQAKVAETAISAIAEDLSVYRDFAGGRLVSYLDGMTAIADPETGLAHLRIQSLRANVSATTAAEDTTNAVLEIANRASLRGIDSQNAITARAAGIANDATEVKNNLVTMGWMALIFVVCVLVLNHFLISRPLNAISRTTERLSRGDMSPVTGFDRASDEIARIALALKVFRDGLVEKEEITRIAEVDRAANEASQTNAVNAIGTGLAHLARGDLTYRLEDEMTEGYAQLKDDFNRTVDALKVTVADVVGLSGSIQKGSAEISQASDNLSIRTASQAATLEQTTAAIQLLATSVQSAATSAREAETTTQGARSEASKSVEVVQSTEKAMKDIEESSSQIVQIIGVIDDIAFQTNLLALNAGVEAARAGDAGRGFAVVASEVQSLAQRTSEAAKEIKSLIVKSAVQVEQGVELVDSSGQALQNIVKQVTHIAELVSNIADATSHQATSLAETNIAISQLDQVTQKNAEMVEETTASGHLLSSDSEKLAMLMTSFSVSSPSDTVKTNSFLRVAGLR